ncbi:MAG: hypothetical protein A2W23_00670 [Planctomycetes bacterium RBG_16_43_13]|nr:MAG: hypothetical protein A2W23_00670 [Planctomycetes bacterium RBG_16_43_13]
MTDMNAIEINNLTKIYRIRVNICFPLVCRSFRMVKFVVYDTILDYIAFQVISKEPRFGILFDTESVIEWFRHE